MILFLDDELSILQSLKRTLRSEPFHIIATHDHEEALDYLKKYPVSIVVSDYRMPRMNGVEFLEKALIIQPFAIRIILSGYADTKSVLDSINKGQVYRFLTKPWDDAHLKQTLLECLLAYQDQFQERPILI
jgi:response regulator RpfG family c-di-GMP phosphodiesterase